jgi:hypothetical protein
MIGSLIDNGFERILREAAIALLKLLSFYLSGGTEENYCKLRVASLLAERFEHRD